MQQLQLLGSIAEPLSWMALESCSKCLLVQSWNLLTKCSVQICRNEGPDGLSKGQKDCHTLFSYDHGLFAFELQLGAQ